MTVKQLIAALKKMPQDVTVYRSDSEYSYDHVNPRNIADLIECDKPYDETELFDAEGKLRGYRRKPLRKGVLL